MFPCCSDKLSNKSAMMEDVINVPHEVFANDLMFFLSEESKINWVPSCYLSYTIHPNSPFTVEVRRIIHIWFGESCDSHFKGNYDWHETKWEMYQNFCRDVTCTLRKLSTADIPEAVSVPEVFFHVISVAKLSIVVYEDGELDALTFAAARIAEALEECNRKTGGMIFNLFDKYASATVNRFTGDYALIGDIVNRPHEVFANDLVLFLSHKRRAACTPRCCQLSKIHRNSPLSEVIRKFVEKMYKKPESYYKLSYSLYEKGCKTQWEVLQAMSDGMTCEFRKMSIKDIPSEEWVNDNKLVNEFFNKVVHFAQISVILHQRCTHATLSLGQLKLAEFLRVCNEATHGRIFDLITSFASSVFKILAGRNSVAVPSGVILRYKLTKPDSAEDGTKTPSSTATLLQNSN